MNAKAFKTLSNLYDYIDDETVVIFQPNKKIIQDYAETFYRLGYQQGKKDTYKVTSEIIKEIK